MKHIFIINPTSGIGKYKNVEKWLHQNFSSRDDDFEIHYTDYPGHAKLIASRYGKNHILYSVGGDGTAHEVLNGMNLDSELAIIPVGTGNDFYRMLPESDATIEEILENTINGETRHVDIGEANGHRFLNCLNFGVDSEVNKSVNAVRHPMFPRKIIYMHFAIVKLLQKKPINVTVEFDGNRIRKKVLLTSIMNGKWYGGGFKSAPEASIDDGYLDMCIVEDIPLRKIPRLMPKYYKGTHLDLDPITFKKIKKVRITADQEFALGLDGEVLETSQVDVGVLEHALKLRTPVEHSE